MTETKQIYAYEIKPGDVTRHGTVVEIKEGMHYKTLVLIKNGATSERQIHNFGSLDVEV